MRYTTKKMFGIIGWVWLIFIIFLNVTVCSINIATCKLGNCNCLFSSVMNIIAYAFPSWALFLTVRISSKQKK